jgi:YVTN family beta-propeller protein
VTKSARPLAFLLSFAAALVAYLAPLHAADKDYVDAGTAQMLPTGQRITPTAATDALFQQLDPELAGYPAFRAGMAVTTVASHDGKTLLILTSGFNSLADKAGKRDAAASNEYVFVFDISARSPRKLQVVPVPNTDSGLAFAPDDRHFYVSGGVDDNLHVFAKAHDRWDEDGAPIALGHKHGLGIIMKPSAAGLDVSADGRKIVIADRHNDAITIVDPVDAQDDRANSICGRARTIPRSMAWRAANIPIGCASRATTPPTSPASATAKSCRSTSPAPRPRCRARSIQGVPNRMVLNADQSLLYVAADNSDLVSVIDTKTGLLAETIPVAAPPGIFANPQRFKGARRTASRSRRTAARFM